MCGRFRSGVWQAAQAELGDAKQRCDGSEGVRTGCPRVTARSDRGMFKSTTSVKAVRWAAIVASRQAVRSIGCDRVDSPTCRADAPPRLVAPCRSPATRRDRPVRGYVRPTSRRPSRHRCQRPPRPRARRRRADGGQRAVAEGGQPADHAGRSTGWRWSRPRSADVPGLDAGRLEIDRGGPSYTADTLAALAGEHPGAELFTIVGDDAAAGLDHLGALRRGRRPLDAGRRRPAGRAGRAAGASRLGPRRGAPARGVEHRPAGTRVSDGRPLDYLVTDPVLQVIAARGLYQEAG